MTLTKEEEKELDVLSEISTDYMCADAMLHHAVSNLQNCDKYLKETDGDMAYEIQKIAKKIEGMKEENKKKRLNIQTRIEELWRRYDD